MKFGKVFLILPAALLAGLLAAGPALPATPPAAASLIATARPSLRAFSRELPWFGTVESRVTAELIALMPGRVEKIEAEDQGRVAGGQVVMRLGGPQVAAHRARLTTAVDSLNSQLALARASVDRFERSLKAQLASKDQLAAAQQEQLRLSADLADARASLESFEAQVAIAAPVAGIFTGRRVVAGQEVTAGQALAEIVDPGRLRIVAELFPPPGIDLLGRPATVRLDGERSLPAVVRRLLPRGGATGGLQVWLEGPDVDRRLRPGQTVAGEVEVLREQQSLAVPESAVVYDEREEPLLFVLQGKVYVARHVRLGLSRDGWVEVRSGLAPAEEVVIRGAYELFFRNFNEQFKVED